MYRVVKDFFDLQDSDHFYKAGDTFPRDGIKVGEKRLEELTTGNNRQGTPLIEAVEEAPAAEEEKAPEQEEVKAPAKSTRKKK